MIATLEKRLSPPEYRRLRRKYDASAERYLDSLTIENIMESTPAATQRKITWDAFEQVKIAYPNAHVLNELLVQYPLPTTDEPGKVNPDNMVCLFEGELHPMSNFSTEIEEAELFIMFEYVSRASKRKDYSANKRKYERDLKVPYYLIFDPVSEKLNLFHLNSRGVYSNAKKNARGRYEIPELEVELAVIEGWVRYWFRGELLERVGEVKRALDCEREENRLLKERLRALGERVD